MMQCADESLKKAAFSVGQQQQQGQPPSESQENDDAAKKDNHLLYIGKVDLPHHPIRMRYLPHTGQRYLLYGNNGLQEMAISQPPETYYLQTISWEMQICDCVQSDNMLLYVISRGHTSAVLGCYDEFMSPQKLVEIPYPLGCLSSLATNKSCTYLYGTNQELNCVIRFTGEDLNLSTSERFGYLWRPFDCCVSQAFDWPDGSQVEFMFVSNLDAGICVFNLNTMEVVAECGDDMSSGAKYLSYDPKRNFLFVSCACDRLLRCYKFELTGESSTPPSLQKIGDFLVANRKPSVRSSGPQCIMWDPEFDHLAVISWSHVKGKFHNKMFRVNI